MPGMIMDGRIVAQKIRSKIKERVGALSGSQVEPNLVTILVGDNPASQTYLKNKHAACMDVGIRSRNIELPGHRSTGTASYNTTTERRQGGHRHSASAALAERLG